ncbi:hypothetical protein LTR78_008502 [Recurvomyces mirabilis]|uniref:PH domain-containing protein n=1 Tax=Recurvomyces mirabilis TaxID=574656 RepID=A0AAE0WIY2_9PEZI|nr:hypothetical protein LTR78_008502 [Recurvomyces mirabilis]KAK5156254.1 hypothetical protein LTS14_005141 [Recurvomyces mirabilis]
MSLFNLFSRPKVEKARGYAEAGLAPTPALKTKQSGTSRLDLLAQEKPVDAPARSASALSFRRHIDRPASRTSNNRPAGPPTRRTAFFEPPPLFQAYPQSAKDGTLRVSSVTAETVLQKNKYRQTILSVPETTPRGSTDDSTSIQARPSAKTSLRHVANGSITSSELPRKVIVLVSAGYLLQYAETGPANRLPERVLQLGKDSAAFACDLIPGKHFVLQISQTVDQQGVIVPTSGSLFTKLGLRSAASKRVASNLLLVMPDATEMNSWMVAIREEIEVLGGLKTRSRTAASTLKDDLEEEADEDSQKSHDVDRDMAGPKKRGIPAKRLSQLSSPPSRMRDDDEKSETGTIDDIEEEAQQLANESSMSLDVGGVDIDAQSIHSSVAASLDQHRLNSLRSNQRISHSTVATTVGSSRANSLSGSPRNEVREPVKLEATAEVPQQKSQYRTLASYLGGRRRSAMPLSIMKEKPLPMPDMHRQSNERNLERESTENRRISSSPRKLVVAVSEPDLRATADLKARHDSRMPTPPKLHEEDERRHSVVGDLPSPATWTNDRSPLKRTSVIQAATVQANAQRASMLRGSTRSSDGFRSRRASGQPSFSLPLRINPSTPENRPPTRDNQSSFNQVEASSGEPTVHVLTAKVEATQPGAPPSKDGQQLPLSRSPSGRLSLFPSATPSPAVSQSPSPNDIRSRSPSAAAMAQAHSQSLKRPTSIQVRSDRAPFAHSMRMSTHGMVPGQAPARSYTAPIRSLRPSRSSAQFQTSRSIPTIATTVMSPASSAQPSPTDPFSGLSASGDLPASVEASDKPTPLPTDRALSPTPFQSGPSSRASGRRVRTMSSLPDLDFGIPVVGLGPPAPPPSVPLPAPPPIGSISRPSSPALSMLRSMPLPPTGMGAISRPSSPAPGRPLPVLPGGMRTSRPTSPVPFASSGLGIQMAGS